jgi:LPS export ABC transporter protein LptC
MHHHGITAYGPHTLGTQTPLRRDPDSLDRHTLNRGLKIKTQSPQVLLATLLSMLGVLTLSGCEQFTGNKEISPVFSADDPGYSVTDAELIETDAEGAPRYRLVAERIVQDPASLLIEVERPMLSIHEQGAVAWRVSADRGELPANTRTMQLTGRVEVISARAEETPTLYLNADTLRYDFINGIADTETDVTLVIDGHELQGTGLQANLKTRRVRLNESVQGRFRP